MWVQGAGAWGTGVGYGGGMQWGTTVGNTVGEIIGGKLNNSFLTARDQPILLFTYGTTLPDSFHLQVTHDERETQSETDIKVSANG